MSNHTRLVIDDPTLTELKLGGVIQPDDLDSFLRALRDVYSVEASRLEREDGVYPETIHLRRASGKGRR